MARVKSSTRRTARAPTAGRCDRDVRRRSSGHRAVLERRSTRVSSRPSITLDPHPRIVLGKPVELITHTRAAARAARAAGVGETLVAAFHTRVHAPDGGASSSTYLAAIGAEVVAAGSDFRFGRAGPGDLDLSGGSASTVARRPGHRGRLVDAIRDAVRDGGGRPRRADARTAVRARRHRRPRRQRGGTLGYPTANIANGRGTVVPRYGIYAGEALGHRAAISIGTNPHYGGTERRIEPFLLDFDGDLYGKRLVVELWGRLRDEQAFDSEEALVEQIGARRRGDAAAERPV